LVFQAFQQECVALVRPLDRNGIRIAATFPQGILQISTDTPAWSMAARMRSTSPPGSTTTAWLLPSSHRIVQFC
jgi:hypothetical protein